MVNSSCNVFVIYIEVTPHYWGPDKGSIQIKVFLFFFFVFLLLFFLQKNIFCEYSLELPNSSEYPIDMFICKLKKNNKKKQQNLITPS